MTLPSRFGTLNPNKVFKLQKTLYGLTQVLRQWFAKISSKLLEYRFLRSYADYSLITYQKDGNFMALLVYVNYLILTGNDGDTCLAFTTYLNSCFHIQIWD